MYDCLNMNVNYSLIVMNILNVTSVMNHNLEYSSIIREVGKNLPKIHCKTTTVEDYSVHISEENLRMLLQLNGVYSYFSSNKKKLLDECEKDLFLNPDST